MLRRNANPCSRFNQQVSDWVEQKLLPGAHHLLMQNGDILNQQVVGAAQLHNNVPLHPHSLFRLASATKIYVSTAFLTLVDAGAVALNDPVCEVLPEYSKLRVFNADGSISNARNLMTMQDLLQHSCGYGYGTNDPYRSALQTAGLLGLDDQGSDCWRHTLSLRNWSSALAALPLESEPGTAVAYGFGHDILGAVIEEVSGLNLEAFMQQQLFAPLQLHDTFFVVPAHRAADLTSYYTADNNQLQEVETAADSSFLETPASFSGGGGWDMLGDGGLVSSAPDFARLLQMILQGGEIDALRILTPAQAALLNGGTTNHLDQSEMLPGCSYSFGVGCVESETAYAGHGPAGKMWWGGSTNTYFFYVPASQRLGVFLTHTLPFAHLNAIYQFDRLAAAPL